MRRVRTRKFTLSEIDDAPSESISTQCTMSSSFPGSFYEVPGINRSAPKH